MKPHPLLPDDPRLTAYALGELPAGERAFVEAALAAHPALQATVDDVRETAAQLESALAAEAAGLVAAADDDGPTFPVENGALEPAIEARPHSSSTGTDYSRRKGRGTLLQFPQVYFAIAGAAAACFAVLVAVYRDRHPLPDTLQGARNRPIAAATSTAPATYWIAVPLPAPEGQAAFSGPPEPTAAAPLGLLAQTKQEQDRRNIEVIADAQGISALQDSAGVATAPVIVPADPTATPAPGAPAVVAVNADRFAPGINDAGANPAAPRAVDAIAASPSAPRVTAQSPAAVGNKPEDRVPLGAGRDQSFDASSLSADITYAIRRPVPSEELPRAPRDADFGRSLESYGRAPDHAFVSVARAPKSTFALFVDPSGYSAVRHFIERGVRPAREVVKIEELLNYFPYDYATPKPGQAVAASLEVAAAPWAPAHRLVRIGLAARATTPRERPLAHLVFLVDVSSSMGAANKLPLIQEGLRRLVGQLRLDDRISLITYDHGATAVMRATPVSQAAAMARAIEALATTGDAEGGRGIQLAYAVARAHSIKDGVNRVVLCTDGDFNFGLSSEQELLRLVEQGAGAGISLSAFAFGSGRFEDPTLEALAQRGHGRHGYADTAPDAMRLLVEELPRTLAAVARDVSVEVEFNPAQVARYRLIGYENRPGQRRDFNLAHTETHTLAAGDTLTALYEIVPVDADTAAGLAASGASRKYGATGAVSSRLEMPGGRQMAGGDLLSLQVNYRNPTGFFAFGQHLDFTVADQGAAFADASPDFRFAAAVAQFGMILRDSPHKGVGTMRDVVAWAAGATADDRGGYRRQFVDLARKAQQLLQ